MHRVLIATHHHHHHCSQPPLAGAELPHLKPLLQAQKCLQRTCPGLILRYDTSSSSSLLSSPSCRRRSALIARHHHHYYRSQPPHHHYDRSEPLVAGVELPANNNARSQLMRSIATNITSSSSLISTPSCRRRSALISSPSCRRRSASSQALVAGAEVPAKNLALPFASRIDRNTSP